MGKSTGFYRYLAPQEKPLKSRRTDKISGKNGFSTTEKTAFLICL
jgi:hypothetical protein